MKSNLKKLLLLGLIGFVLMGTTFSQALEGKNNDPTARAKEKTERMKEKLNLSADQEIQVYEIFLKQISTKQESRERYKNASQEEKAELRKTMRSDLNNQLQAVLNEEQWAQAQEILHKRKKTTRSKMNRSPAEKLERMKTELNLSDEQVNQIRPILEKADANRKDILEKNKPSIDQLKNEMKTNREATQAEILKFLDQEQAAKLKEHRDRKKAHERSK